MSESRQGDPRDTSTPTAMVAGLRRLALGKSLSMGSRSFVIEWLIENKTGGARLRVGLPKDWKVGDKTGSGPGTTNDVVICWPPHHGPVLVAAYLTGSPLSSDARNRIIASVGKAAAEYLRTAH